MKQVISLLAVFLLVIGGVMAATTVEHTWSGDGVIDSVVTADDDHTTHFYVSGNNLNGKLEVTDNNDNPYNYNVDTVNSFINSRIGNGGWQFYEVDRLDSKESMYGNPGQKYYVEMYSNESVELATNVRSNFASMISATYGKPKTTLGNNFEASGDYGIYHYIKDGDNDGASLEAVGLGTAQIDSMSSEIKGRSFKFGKGAGSFTNADSSYTGTGMLRIQSWADNAIDVDAGNMHIPGDGSNDSATYDLKVTYSGNFNYASHALSGN